MMTTRISILPGAVFGRLTVIHEAGRSKRGDMVYHCRCECGRETKPHGSSLRLGLTRSCGHHSHPPRAELVNPESALRRMFRAYRRAATARALDFQLSFEQLRALVDQPCRYCGVAPAVNSYSGGAKIPVAVNGIDRYDSNLGYTQENTVACCKLCNNAKWNLSISDFTAWLQRAAKHLEGTL